MRDAGRTAFGGSHCGRRSPALGRVPGPTPGHLILLFLLLATAILSAAQASSAADGSASSQQEARDAAPGSGGKTGTSWSEDVDIVGTFNPLGLEASAGYSYTNAYRYDEHYDAVSASWTAGPEIALTPSFLRPSLSFEWMPFLFLTTRFEYDGYYYLGANGGMLSFSSAADAFGDRELRARKGTEDSGRGSRLLLQPTVQLRIGDIVLRNQSDIARYRFPGSGPFFHEQEYDTLLKDGGLLFANRTQVLKEKTSGGDTLLFGPYFELVHAAVSDIVRRQIGILLYSERSRSTASADESHYFLQIGYNLRDRNREGEIFILIGTGLSSAVR